MGIQRQLDFDPDMIDAFLKVQEEFRNIATEFADSEEEKQALLKN